MKMQIAIEENDAVLNGKYYINSASGRDAVRQDFGQDPATLKQVFAVWGDSPTEQDPQPPTIDDLRAQKKNEIAAARYSAEISGVVVDGVTVDTGRDSQALITGAAVSAMLDGEYSLNWKTENGFIHLTAPEIIAVAQAVRDHVQECFDKEGELVARINAAITKEELDAIKW